MEFIKYSELTQTYNRQTIVPLRPNLNGYSARNVGTSVAIVNNKRLLPAPFAGVSGEAVSMGGNLGEIYEGIIEIKFEAAGNDAVEITQKFYVPGKGVPEKE